MPRHIQNVKKVYVHGSSCSELQDQIKITEELLKSEGLLSSVDSHLSSKGIYQAEVTGYRVLREW